MSPAAFLLQRNDPEVDRKNWMALFPEHGSYGVSNHKTSFQIVDRISSWIIKQGGGGGGGGALYHA